MKITPLWLKIAIAANILLPLVVFVLLKPRDVLDDPHVLWQMPLAMAVICVVAAIVCLFIVVILKKEQYETRIYFFGQLAVPIFLAGTIGYFLGYNFMHDRKYGNVEANKSLMEWTYDGESRKDSSMLMALGQLESTFDNKNDLRIQECYTSRADTVINDVYDSALFIMMVYTSALKGETKFSSNHFIHAAGSRMLYYGIPVNKNKELLEKIATIHHSQ